MKYFAFCMNCATLRVIGDCADFDDAEEKADASDDNADYFIVDEPTAKNWYKVLSESFDDGNS